jgi:hypothetical protein
MLSYVKIYPYNLNLVFFSYSSDLVWSSLARDAAMKQTRDEDEQDEDEEKEDGNFLGRMDDDDEM